ncbi:MAG: hypothetical protein KDB01_05305, partial [Planctomycetaceae bacterium]|nr:hypothetical protein [Planctomycetaceae bacterium]
MKARPSEPGKLWRQWSMRLLMCLVFLHSTGGLFVCRADDGIEFFERKIRPVLVEHCYRCHSSESKELQGELRLDLKAGWQLGGESGEPSVVPGNPDQSPLILAMRHNAGASAMPPDQPRLSDAIINDFVTWVRMGAPDP